MSDGARLKVVECGEAGSRRPPFVLLHGITLSSDIWHFQLSDLAAAGYRVVAPDLRGHGGSESKSLTLDRMSDDLAELLEQLELNGAVLVGHSMGGMVAIRMLGKDAQAAKGRGRVGSLALISTSANVMSGYGIPAARALLGGLEPVLSRAARVASWLPGPTLPRSDLSYLLARVNFGHKPPPSQVSLTTDIVTRVPARVSAELVLQILRFDDVETLRDVELPALVVVGTRDLVTSPRHGRALAAAIGGADLVVFDECGHMVMLERRLEFGRALVALADRTPRPRVFRRPAAGRVALR
jgi:pimeloyl-ACP methyl ester carboxylesterase